MSVAIDIQDAKRIRPIIFPSMACLGVRFFDTLHHKQHDFRKILFHIKRVLIVSTNLSETFLILRRTGRDIVVSLCRSSCKVPAIDVTFQ